MDDYQQFDAVAIGRGNVGRVGNVGGSRCG